jgi:hypothetical protein
MSPRTLLASGAIALTIAGIGYAAHPAAKPPAKCAPTKIIPGEFRCTFPTHSHLRAVVYVQTFEDGSARAIAIDPDAKEKAR